MPTRYNNKRYLEKRVAHDLNYLHSSKKPTIIIRNGLREPSAISSKNNITFNREYLNANKSNRSLVDRLVAHEVSHVVSRDGDGEPHFKRIYQKLTGSPNPQYLPNERFSGIRYVYVCPCGYRYYFFGKPHNIGFCPNCGKQLYLRKL